MLLLTGTHSSSMYFIQLCGHAMYLNNLIFSPVPHLQNVGLYYTAVMIMYMYVTAIISEIPFKMDPISIIYSGLRNKLNHFFICMWLNRDISSTMFFKLTLLLRALTKLYRRMPYCKPGILECCETPETIPTHRSLG